ncbi:MAG TPA: cysteine hydrolase [Rhodospirillales bacterium]|nr:cysteine hydrolase [Rhodospirillales bacterium]
MTSAPRPEDARLTRLRPIEPRRTALLIIDVQNWVLDPSKHPPRPEFYEDAQRIVIPNLGRLLTAARRRGLEIVYTVMENLTRDGRDRSLDYKLSGFFIAKGSRDARVIDALAPQEDEILLPKTSSSLFNSTNFDYLMRNIGIDTIIATGFLTDQCVDHTVRDGADRGYYMICVEDACATDTRARHRAALDAFRGYCRLVTTDGLLAELGS